MITFKKILRLLLLSLSLNLSFSQSRAIDSLQKIIDQGGNDVENIFSLNNIASEYAKTDMVKAKSDLYRAINFSTQPKNDVSLSYSY